MKRTTAAGMALLALTGCGISNDRAEGSNEGYNAYNSALTDQTGQITKDGWRNARIECLTAAKGMTGTQEAEDAFFTSCMNTVKDENARNIRLVREASEKHT